MSSPGWDSDLAIHALHVEAIQKVARTEDPMKRAYLALSTIVSFSATSSLKDDKFRSFASVVADTALAPSIYLVEDKESHHD